MFMHHPGFGGSMMWFGVIWQLLVVALIVLGVVLVVRTLSNRPASQGPPSRGPLQILEERFARGEIDEDEFRTRREALRS